ncbi:UDP-glucose/GDP-mannose dehydrogenase family protein [Desulfurococcaceae archaeon MEX13E-LK6-19]|nr:UDP-glucose/GDP-mannose dehydrogenase family protein [Desulfurococcaceae archaeon MEX13E-LK6-19]
MPMKIGVIGLGFVGLTLAAALASKEYDVVGIDLDVDKIDKIKKGIAPFHEEGLEEILRSVIGKHLVVSNDYSLLRDVDLVFIAVGTPPRPDGSQEQKYIVDAVRSLARTWKRANGYKVVVIKSTVVPGTTRRLASIASKESGLVLGENLGFVMNPEFLREGKALYDTFYPSRVVIGCTDEKSCSIVKNLWEEFYRKVGKIPPILVMSPEEAELVKYASNVFLAMRVSFANTIANICELTPNCDVMKVLEATGLDPRIGSKYLRPGLGYGGSCLPKDVKALIHYSTEKGYDPILIKAVDEVNERQPFKAIEYLMREYSSLKGKTIAILGLAFKPDTDDIREAVSLKIINKLLELGATVKVHDPKAMDNVRRIYGDKLVYCNTPEEAIKDSDAVVIVTEWDVYKSLKPRVFKDLMRNPVVIDGRRIYDPLEFIAEGIKFYAIGLGSHSL